MAWLAFPAWKHSEVGHRIVLIEEGPEAAACKRRPHYLAPVIDSCRLAEVLSSRKEPKIHHHAPFEEKGASGSIVDAAAKRLALRIPQRPARDR